MEVILALEGYLKNIFKEVFQELVHMSNTSQPQLRLMALKLRIFFAVPSICII